MLDSTKNREDWVIWNGLILLQGQVKASRLQDRLWKQKFHECLKKMFEPVTDRVKDVPKHITKTMTESSQENINTLKTLNHKLLEVMNDRGNLASYLLPPLSKIANSKNTRQFRLIKYLSSNRVNDLLINKTIPVTLHDNLLTFRDTEKIFNYRMS